MIIGNYCLTWAEATHGMPNGISLNTPYRFHWLKVVRIEGKTLHATGGGDPMQLAIKRERRRPPNREYVLLTMADPIFGPITFRTYPFKGTER